MKSKLTFRYADKKDTELILKFIVELAKYEELENEVVATEQLLEEWLFEKKKAEVIFAVSDGKEIGFALFFHNFKDNTVVERIFKGIRPAVVALIAAPTFSMAKSAKINRYNVWIPIVSALIIWLLDFSPIWVIIIAGVGGYLYGRLHHPKVES